MKMLKTTLVLCGMASLLLVGTGLVLPGGAEAASARSTANAKRPSAAKRTHVPGKKVYTTKLTARKAAMNQSKQQSRQQDGRSATNRRNAGTFTPVAVTWSDARRNERREAGDFGFTVQKRSTSGRGVTFRDQRGSVASEVPPRLQRNPDGTIRVPTG